MMKPLLYGTAMAAALAAAAPGWAQQSTMTPSGTPTTTQAAPYAQTAPTMPQVNSYGTPRPGAYQQTPQAGAYTQQPTAAATQPMPATAATAASGTTGEQATEAMPTPRGRHASRRHHARHGHMTASASRRGGGTSDHVADQLNREEAGRLSSGSSMAPGAPGQPQQMR